MEVRAKLMPKAKEINLFMGQMVYLVSLTFLSVYLVLNVTINFLHFAKIVMIL